METCPYCGMEVGYPARQVIEPDKGSVFITTPPGCSGILMAGCTALKDARQGSSRATTIRRNINR
jgi:hypothetical protein